MRGRSVAGALALSSLLLAAACSSSGSSGARANGAGAAGAGEVSSAPVANSDNNAWALRYTGGSAGPAKGTPYKIGFVSQDTFLPSATQGARAAVAYVDAELGGVGGRPIELVSCSVNVPEDAARCGAQMANDASLSLVIVGGLSVGNKEFYDAVGGRKAILIGNALASEDFVTTRGVAYTAGSPGVLMGMARFAVEELKARTVAGIVPDTPAGRAAAQQLVKPILDAAKVKFRPVFISLQATTPDLTTALQASGAGSADALITAFPRAAASACTTRSTRSASSPR
ncbi:ABC transporter substrate-binding protein [Frankia sp. ArI3]|uniref:ABC transporter substrate-binding protein n=1 Tax=Frankia sp. ArI3 TaxID=1858 RepID=UPI002105EDC8|nr:ABC transporter substrate-binding protein [Frankia sp. ArI3]